MKKPVGLFLLPLLLFCHILSASPDSAEDAVRKTTDEVIRWINIDRDDLKKDHEYLKILVQELIIPHFDFAVMSKLVLGDHWQELGKQNKICFSKGFRNMLVERYARVLLSYNNQSITYEPSKPIGEKGYVSVRQTITRDGAKPLPIEYSMYHDGKSWKAADLVIDGISLIKSYRNTFSDEIHILGLDEFIRSFPDCVSPKDSAMNSHGITTGSLTIARL
jgi:phospholipid transport system substrate-binding protein